MTIENKQNQLISAFTSLATIFQDIRFSFRMLKKIARIYVNRHANLWRLGLVPTQRFSVLLMPYCFVPGLSMEQNAWFGSRRKRKRLALCQLHTRTTLTGKTKTNHLKKLPVSVRPLEMRLEENVRNESLSARQQQIYSQCWEYTRLWGVRLIPVMTGEMQRRQLFFHTVIGNAGLMGKKMPLEKKSRFDGIPHTVIGVMPKDFHFPFFLASQCEAWTPIGLMENR